MIVKSIIIYPIKGMKGTNLNSCRNLIRGFENDRRYMLIDKDNTFISQRSHPILALIHPKIMNEEIHIDYDGYCFSFPLELASKELIEIGLFDNTIQGRLVSKELDKHFSKLINDEVRLVKMANDIYRSKKLIKGPDSTLVSFADGYPYLIAGTASLSKLNQKMEQAVLMDRFRPNIIVETKVPHQEDEWESIQIGEAKMMVIKPCARCPVVTINQQTGEKKKDTLKVLSTYRKKDNKVYFGANAISLENNIINVGDTVIAL